MKGKPEHPSLADWYRMAHKSPGIPPSALDEMARSARVAAEARKLTDSQLTLAIIKAREVGETDLALLLEEVLDERREEQRTTRHP
jgi:hypothetical protein